MMNHDHNRRAWDHRVRQGARFTSPVDRRLLADPLPEVDRAGWLGASIKGQRVLCLAAGGGRHGPIYASAGAQVTVVDISGEMLALDREVAAAQSHELRTVQASMDDLPLPSASFDIVIHPVSTCYVPKIAPVYREVARVLVIGGVYISQHKQPASLQATANPSPRGYEVTEPYYRTEPLPPVAGSLHREEGTLEYLHRWEELIGELCRAGFVIEDFAEPLHAEVTAAPGEFSHRSRYLPPYVRIKARRIDRSASEQRPAALWQP
jgi:ubiquinone/menaquinone biosynthesis C-methylase UbiE